MRPLKLIRLVALITLIAALPVLGVIAAYAQTVPDGKQSSRGHGLLSDPYLNGPAPMAGQNVVTTDGRRVGEVTAVTETAAGRVKAMQFKTGGFWGFGQRTVVVPAGRFTVTGQNVYINYSAGEVALMPEGALPASQG